MLPEVFAFELDTRPVLVADGAWLLPSFVAGLELPDTEGTAFSCSTLTWTASPPPWLLASMVVLPRSVTCG